jgi:hypothetical protein
MSDPVGVGERNNSWRRRRARQHALALMFVIALCVGVILVAMFDQIVSGLIMR